MCNGTFRELSRFAIASALLLFATIGTSRAQVGAVAELTRLSLQELADLEVTSTSRKPEKVSHAADPIFVITGEDIVRSGAETIPEALRLAPGVHVSRIDSNKWAVGIRGFASRLSRSLLVLVDGRSVYTPLFAGVYWEVQDLVLEDVERIEVIRGPGATLWGANAVNGVINIITKSATETQGGHGKLVVGDEDLAIASVRQGGPLGERAAWRVYGKGNSRDGGFHPDTPEFDEWNKAQAGFRIDARLGESDSLTVQGDAYKGDFGTRTTVGIYDPPFSATLTGDADLSGGNVLARLSFPRERTDSRLQGYFDRTHRDDLNFREDRNTIDLDWQQRVRSLPGRQDLVWGAGFRLSRGRTSGDFPTVQFIPARKSEELYSVFVEDEFAIGRSSSLSFGSKFEHNEYSGSEFQPSVRFAWVPVEKRQTLWASVSRALRTPTRTDTDLSLTANLVPGSPTFVRVLGSRDFEPERVLAYQAGWRFSPFARVTADAAVFYDDYKRQLSLETGPTIVESDPPSPPRTVLLLVERNLYEGRGYGFELSSRIEAASWCRLLVTYSFLDLELTREENSTDTFQQAIGGSSPRHQALLWGSMSLGVDWDLDAIVRHVGALESQQVPGFTEADLQLTWHAADRWKFSLLGKNLLHRHHPEFGQPVGRVEVERSLAAKAVLTW